MPLTAAESALFKKFILTKLRRDIRHACPTCQTNSWEIDGFFSSRELEGDISLGALTLSEGMRTVPCVHMMCKNCGYIESYSWSVVMDWSEKNG